jgi:AcrR family transcriptional regulator
LAPITNEKEPAGDGRALRGARNRERIVNALLELVRTGELQPTAEQVAERATVGTRTVFRHFADMDVLYAELSARIEREVRPLAEEPLPPGSLVERAVALTRRRAAIFERIAPFRRAGDLQRWRSAFLQRDHAQMARDLRADLLARLPELAEAPAARVEALDLLTSFEAWNRLRTDQRLGRERAADAMETAVRSLLRG